MRKSTLIGRIVLVLAVVLLSASRSQAVIESVALQKSMEYGQTSAAQPTTGSRFGRSVRLTVTAPTDCAVGTYTWAGTGDLYALPKSNASTVCQISSVGPSQAAIDAAMPLGPLYTFTVTGGTLGTQSITAATPASPPFPGVPYFTGLSYAATQAYVPGLSQLLTFDGFSVPAGATDGSTSVTITRAANGSVVFDQSSLSPSATSVVIPANTLQASVAYDVTLAYHTRLLGTTSGTASSLIALDQQTAIRFTTIPEPAAASVVAVAAAMLERRRRRNATAPSPVATPPAGQRSGTSARPARTPAA